MKTKHTPGLWGVHFNVKHPSLNEETENTHEIFSDNSDYWVAFVQNIPYKHGRANAELIAAAPEMFTRLQETLDFLIKHVGGLDFHPKTKNPIHTFSPTEFFDRIQDTIEKATS